MMRRAFAIICMLTATQVAALQLPKSCGFDSRIRCVDYNPDEVVGITAMFGLQTFILFANGEEVEDLGGGDTEAWDIGVLTRKNGIFIKPKSFKPATNISVVTNKRYYNFDFKVEQLKNAEDRNYMTRFKYREDEVKATKKISAAQKAESMLSNAVSSKRKNEDYWVEGSDVFTPTAAWDDGETTYFRFSPNTALPAVYLVSEDGTETLMNKHFPETYTMAIQTIGKKFIFRKDGVFTCIYNESYDRHGVENQSRTSSPSVKRVIREDKRNDVDKKDEPKTIMMKPIVPSASSPGSGFAQQPSSMSAPTINLGGSR